MEQFLKKDTLGRTIFSPWGGAGAGYLLPDEPKCQQVRRFLMQSIGGQALFILGAVLSKSNVIPPACFFTLLLLLIVWYAAVARSLVRGLTVVRERPAFQDYCGQCADSINFPSLLAIFIVCLLFAWGSAFTLSRGNYVTGIAGVAIFGTFASVCAYLLRVKWERTRQKKQVAKLREKAH